VFGLEIGREILKQLFLHSIKAACAYTAFHYNAFRPPLHGSILRQCLGQDSFSKVLDIGCGAGHSTVALAEFCQKAVGFDVSQSTLQQAL
jgi:methylase of polypeptide subunit release factors